MMCTIHTFMLHVQALGHKTVVICRPRSRHDDDADDDDDSGDVFDLIIVAEST